MNAQQKLLEEIVVFSFYFVIDVTYYTYHMYLHLAVF